MLHTLATTLSHLLQKFNSSKGTRLALLVIVASVLVGGIFLWKKQDSKVISSTAQIAEASPLVATASATPVSSSPAPSASPTPPKSSAKILFGYGSQAGPAMNYRIVKEAPVHMLTSWYNGPSDLEWMRVQKEDAIRRVYAGKYVVHLVTWSDPQYSDIQTPHGSACGTPYPVSTQILDDMRQLAQIWNGPGQMYVTLFTEFQTYTCTNNTWNGNENYYNALKDNFRKIKDIFHQYAPGSKVALSWGGWQSRYDDPTNKAGRSFFPYFDDIMRESDFVAFQSMESDTNINEILDMSSILSKFGKPIMVSHYKPANNSQSVFDNDMRWLFTDSTVKQLTDRGLFAFSFMDTEGIDHSEASFQIVKNGIQKYGK